jgi:hypothetical protein
LPSNTSKGRGQKGSKFWIQTLVNLDNGAALTKAIKRECHEIDDIKWLSPLHEHDYQELKTHQIERIKPEHLKFWPDGGPWWDGVGIDQHGCVILVEAKGHPRETITSCKADNPVSRELIINSMRSAHQTLAPECEYQDDIWFKKYYQLGNRLTFLVMLKDMGIDIRLVLLNIVDDPTHIKTTEEQWQKHYQKVFSELLGASKVPEGVVLVNFKV